jgi:hypothetical protein
VGGWRGMAAGAVPCLASRRVIGGGGRVGVCRAHAAVVVCVWWRDERCIKPIQCVISFERARARACVRAPRDCVWASGVE